MLTDFKSRFNEMFGDPENNKKQWTVSNIAEISECDLSYGSGASAIEYDGLLRYIRITDITDDGNLNDDIVSPSIVDDKYRLHEGDLLFARSGATAGKTFLYHDEYGAAIYAGYLIRSVPKKSVINPYYFYYFTKSNYYNSFLSQVKRGAAQPNINAKQYGSLKICVPPIEIQNQFANFVKQIDKSKVIKESAKSRFNEMFCDGEYDLVKIGDCCKTISGGTPSSKNSNYYENGTIPWVNSGEVDQGYIYQTEKKITRLGLDNSSAKMIPIDSVLVAMYGATVGNVGILKISACSNQAVCSILPNDYFIPEYLLYCLRNKEQYFLDQAIGGAQPNISQTIIRETMVPLPPIKKQNEFADFIRQIDKSKVGVLSTILLINIYTITGMWYDG